MSKAYYEFVQTGIANINVSEKGTNVEGVYAIGDVTNNPFKQAIVACGEAALAALAAYKKVRGIKE